MKWFAHLKLRKQYLGIQEKSACYYYEVNVLNYM